MTEKYYNKNGDVAVLISRGYGAGWSTWANSEHAEAVLFDKNIVQMLLDNPLKRHDGSSYNNKEGVDKIEAYTKEKYPGTYCGGADSLKIHWLKPGTVFMVDEYDGAESLVTKEDIVQYCA